MNDPIATAEQYNLEHPPHPAERPAGELRLNLLCGLGYLTIIVAVLYLALES